MLRGWGEVWGEVSSLDYNQSSPVQSSPGVHFINVVKSP